MSTLAPLLREFRGGLPDRSESGVAPTGVPGVTFFWVGEAVSRAPLLYSAGLVIIGQGRKVGYLGDRQFDYGAETCLVLGIPDADGEVVLLKPDLGVPDGGRMY